MKTVALGCKQYIPELCVHCLCSVKW